MTTLKLLSSPDKGKKYKEIINSERIRIVTSQEPLGILNRSLATRDNSWVCSKNYQSELL
jgi:hypothetical protein